MGLISRVSSRTYRIFFFLPKKLFKKKMPVKLPYVQELPPTQGYPKVPYKRNIPVRGGSMAAVAGFVVATFYLAKASEYCHEMYENVSWGERQHALAAWKVVVDAERRRHEVRRRKEYLEQLNLNLVSTGIYPHLDPIRDYQGQFAPFNECDGGRMIRNDWGGPDGHDYNSQRNERPNNIHPNKRAMAEYHITKGGFAIGP